MTTTLALTLVLLAAAPEAAPPLLTLDGAIQAAKEHNLDLKVAQAKLDQARQASSKAWSGYLPQLSVGGSYVRNSAEAKMPFVTGYYIRTRTPIPGMPDPAPDPGFDPNIDPNAGLDPAKPLGGPTPYFLFPKSITEVVIQSKHQFGAQVQLSQALIAPVLWPIIQSAYLGEQIAELSVDNGRRELLFGVAQLYYGAVGLKQTVQIQERLLDLNRRHEQDAQVRYAAGTVPQMAVLRAQIDRTRAEQDLKRAQNSYLSAKLALAGLLNRDEPFDVELPPDPVLPANLTGLEEAALRDRPDVAATRTGVKLAESQRTASLFKYLPNLGLSAAYRGANVSGFTGQYDSWAVTLGVNWVLFDGGLREAELRESAARLVEAENTRQSAERKARDDVARLRLELDSAQSNRTKAAEQLRMARQNSDLVSFAYREGSATYLEVEDAKTALLGAELAALGETLSANLSVLKLLKAAGAFNP